MRGYERLAAAIGREAAGTLCELRGGREVYIPERNGGSLEKLIGIEAVRSMRREYGTGRFEVPMGPRTEAALRRKAARALSAEGYSVAQIARDLGMHPKTVRAALKTD